MKRNTEKGALAGGWTVNATLEGVIERKAFGKAKPLAVITGGKMMQNWRN